MKCKKEVGELKNEKSKKLKTAPNKVKKNACETKKKVIVKGTKVQVVVDVNKKSIAKKEKKKKRLKRKQYSSESVKRALEVLKKNNVSVRQVAKTFGIPPATLSRKVNNEDNIDVRSGPKTILSKEEEDNIVHWIIHRAETGSPVTSSELLDSVQSYLHKLERKSPCKNDRPGRRWLENFKKRNSNLTIRTAQTLTTSRAQVSEEELRTWFSAVEGFLVKKDLVNIDPSRVFNCDESSIQFCPKPEKVLAKRGARSVYKISDASEKECQTVLFMYSASGVRAPPLVLYKYKGNLPKKLVENCPSGWGMGVTESGWMCTATFFEYVSNVFYPWLVKENIEFPVIVYMDGHASHITLPLLEFCREKQIEIIALYPNATHIVQPLDIAFFHPFKLSWRQSIEVWKRENDDERVNKENFAGLLKSVLDNFKGEGDSVIHGFAAAGLVPFNPNALDYNVLKKKSKKKQKEIESIENSNVDDTPAIINGTKEVNFLDAFLSQEIINSFQECQESEIWTGDVKYLGLFEYWLELRKKFGKAKSIIKETVSLPNKQKISAPPLEKIQKKSENAALESFEEDLNEMYEHQEVNSFTPGDLNSFENVPHVLQSEGTEYFNQDSSEVFNVEELPIDFVYTDKNIPDLHLDIQDSELILASSSDSTDFINDHESQSSENYKRTSDSSCDSVNLFSNDEQNVPQVFQATAVDHLEQKMSVCSKSKPTTVYAHKTAPESITLKNSKVPSDQTSDTTSPAKNTNIDDAISNKSTDKSAVTNNECDPLDLTLSSSKKDSKTNFNQSFKCPTKYLPKNLKIKIEKSGKKQELLAGTNDSWYQKVVEKEKKQQAKAEKMEKKRKLQAEKKELEIKKKKLQEEIKELQNKIKDEV